MIQQQALVVIEVPRIGVPRVEMPRELQHVVRAAALGRVRTDASTPQRAAAAARASPSALLVPPVTYDRAVAHLVEEIARDIVETQVARDLVAARGGNRLGDVRVGVQPPQLVTAERPAG